MKSYSQIEDLEYLLSCRQALHDNSELQKELARKLNERDSRYNYVLEPGTKERKDVEYDLEKARRFEQSIRQTLLEDFKIQGFRGLTERIQSMQEQNPEYVKQLTELQGQQAVQQESQSNQGQQRQTTQQYTLTPLRDVFEAIRGKPTPNEGSDHELVLSKGKGREIGYDQLYGQSPGQLQEPEPQSAYKSDYDKLYEDSLHHAHPDSPRRERETSYDKLYEGPTDSDNDSNGQERYRCDRDR